MTNWQQIICPIPTDAGHVPSQSLWLVVPWDLGIDPGDQFTKSCATSRTERQPWPPWMTSNLWRKPTERIWPQATRVWICIWLYICMYTYACVRRCIMTIPNLKQRPSSIANSNKRSMHHSPVGCRLSEPHFGIKMTIIWSKHPHLQTHPNNPLFHHFSMVKKKL